METESFLFERMRRGRAPSREPSGLMMPVWDDPVG